METKRCCSCEDDLPIGHFAFKNQKKGLRSSQCKECKNSYNKHWYKTNAEDHKKHVVSNKKKYRLENWNYVFSHLTDHSCVDCGEADPVVLDFDHVRGVKTENISRMIGTYSPTSLKEEIEKCEVRCANCHRRKTAKEQGWRKMFAPVSDEPSKFDDRNWK